MSPPTVTPLPADSSVPRDHHGPTSSSSSTGAKTKYFKNPWPSYRTASLKDAYLAYQLGAAVALPPHQTPGSSRLNLVDMAAYEDEVEDELLERGREERQSILPTATPTSVIGKRLYIRPDFSEVREDDEFDDWREPPVRTVEPKWGDGEQDGSGDGGERVTWLGHAGVLVQIPWKDEKREGMCGVLFDPIFSYRCSPSQYVGPARYVDPPCTVSMLPEIHVCCISHDHYDHLDYYTIMDLWKYHQNTIHFFVPMGLKQWFTSSGIPSHRITQLDWWHESLLSFPSPASSLSFDYPPPVETGSNPADGQTSGYTPDSPDVLTVKVAFTPAQHRSGRGVFDHMTTLWGSWCVGVVEEQDRQSAGERGMRDWEGFKVYFGGDTGYRYATAPEGDDTAICPAFEQIATHYSPFNLSLLPLSTGSSLPFLRTLLSLSLDQYTLTSSLHCSPADSLEIHRIIGAERTLGIHWGTFCDAEEARGTRVEFGRCRRRMGVSGVWSGEEEEDEGRFVVGDIGETLVIPPRPRERS
ncbi:hypothetical protein CI109_101779 [Kwoniella shandongensis]|uniref:Uncharacterized protein n=1 Tax=Kwoniella shandongensis TaxID=1734106 RepID=A0A5M6CB36_9TREE|nr:uncharacterized protein CI109_001099 [Kwoniella shandongensis]KAA5530299.1 hypothetical protein CI109_001099 [Kwoniella shandongensis]